VLVKAYVTYVKPILEYSSVVWSPYKIGDISCIEKVQRSFTKRLPGNEIWDKNGCNSACVRDFCEIFAPVGFFRGWAIECCQLHFSPTDI